MKRTNALRRTILFCGLMSASMVLASCGGSSSSNNSSEPYKANVTIWWPSGKALKTVLNDAITRFNVTYPDITFNIKTKAGLDIYDAFQIALNDPSSCPDIAILDHVYVQNLANEKLLADLTALDKQYGNGKIADSYPSTLYSANLYNGSSYGLPLSANTVTLMGNMDILEAAGISEMPTTWAELLTDCEAIKTKTSYTPFAQPINDSFCAMEFASYTARVGAKIVSDDYKTVLLDSDKAKQAVYDWVDLSKYASKSSYEEGKFYNGTVGFIEMGSWNLSKVTGATALFKCGFSEMVTMEEGIDNYSGLGLYSTVIPSGSDCQPAAYLFSKFLSTDKTFQLAFAKEEDLFPVTNEALSDSYYAKDEVRSVFASQMSKVAPRPGTPVWPKMEQEIVNMLYGAVNSADQAGINSYIATAQKNCQAETNRKFSK